MNNSVQIVANRFFLAFMMLIALNIGGCATIISGTTQDISITSIPEGSDVKVEQLKGAESSLVWQGKTPSTASLKRKNSYLVTISHDGFQKSEVPVEYGSTNGWAWGNLLIGGIIGIIVDGISGASINLKPEKISESLVKLPPIKADIMREELSHVH